MEARVVFLEILSKGGIALLFSQRGLMRKNLGNPGLDSYGNY